MFDIGWTELLLIGIVALIVIGPEDLPRMFHTLGRFVARAKAMAREFQGAMNEAAKESGIDDVASDLRKATSAKSLGIDKLEQAASKFEEWDPAESMKPAKGTARAEELSPERAEVAEKIRAATAKSATERKAAEAGKAAGAGKVAGAGAASAKKSAAKKAKASARAGAAATGAGKPATGRAGTGKSAAGKTAAGKAAGKTGGKTVAKSAPKKAAKKAATGRPAKKKDASGANG